MAVCHARRVAVTSKDIAHRLKISQSTVSRALRGDPRVAPSTMARVLEAARQMNYTPNLAARSLITRRTRTVGVVVGDNPRGGRLVAEAFLELGHRRIAIITGPENTTTSRDRERGFREQLEAGGVPLDETLRRVGRFSHQSGYQWCLDLLAADPRP